MGVEPVIYKRKKKIIKLEVEDRKCNNTYCAFNSHRPNCNKNKKKFDYLNKLYVNKKVEQKTNTELNFSKHENDLKNK